MHPRIPLASLTARAHCWLMVNLSSTRTSRPLSAELLSSRSAPSLYSCMGLFLPMYRTLHLPLLNLIRFLSAQLGMREGTHSTCCSIWQAFAYAQSFTRVKKFLQGPFPLKKKKKNPQTTEHPPNSKLHLIIHWWFIKRNVTRHCWSKFTWRSHKDIWALTS